MNNFAFNLIDAINRDGLGTESWGVVKNVADTVNYFGSKEKVSLSGKWAYIYADKDAVFSLQLDQIEPTMVLHVDDDCDINISKRLKIRAMKKCTFMRYLVTAIVTAAICWLMFRYSFRVDRVYDAGDVVLVEVSILGQCEIHEVVK